jgi:hypothetical protein
LSRRQEKACSGDRGRAVLYLIKRLCWVTNKNVAAVLSPLGCVRFKAIDQTALFAPSPIKKACCHRR